MQSKHSVKPDQDVLFAWREGLAEAASQDVKQQLLQREGELLPRFADYYGKLKHLPRRARRSLQRQWKKSLAGIALLLALGQGPAMAATINVSGTCTLVRAIVAANNDTTATGHCKKGSGADRIVMPRNSTVNLTAVNNNHPKYGASGLPVVRGTITIDGNGSVIRRASNAPAFRIFAVGDSGDLRLQETTVSGGVAAKVAVAGINLRGAGGGLLNFGGKLSLSNSTVSGNRATEGGGVSAYNLDGNSGVDAITTLTNSTVSGNSASSGGGVSNHGQPSYSAELYITNSTVSGNKARFGCGGVNNIYIAGTSITNSTISGNVAGGSGGGVCNDYGGVSLTNSTVSGNRAGGSGGGVLNSYANLHATNSTISGNTAKQGGGGINNAFGGAATLTHTTVSGNKGGTRGGGVYQDGFRSELLLKRTLISGNTAASGREIFNSVDVGDPEVGVTTADFNVFGHSALTKAQAVVGFTPSGTDITATSDGNRPTALGAILNTTLANNGGPTKTNALAAGSPAVDAVNNGTCPPPARDQRGVKRPRDGNGDGGRACDVGSFER